MVTMGTAPIKVHDYYYTTARKVHMYVCNIWGTHHAEKNVNVKSQVCVNVCVYM